MSNDNITAATAAAPAWSPMQQAIFDFVERPNAGSLIVNALAGSGKTTTLVEAVYRIPEDQSVLVLAFNKRIQEELARRLPDDVTVKTAHAFGFSHLQQQVERPSRNKPAYMQQIAGELCGRTWSSKDLRRSVLRLAALGKSAIVSREELRHPRLPAKLEALLDTAGFMAPKGVEPAEVARLAARVLQRAADHRGDINFDDMIWRPLIDELPLCQFDWVLVDEAQDLNEAQHELVRRALAPGGRLIAIGDEHQACYQFRGALQDSMQRMQRHFAAAQLPLSVTYRCPRAVVRQAQKYVPALEAAPAAIDGVVRSCSAPGMIAQAQPGDFVVSRLNAPLVGLCLDWLAQGKPATIQGREFAVVLVEWITATGANTLQQLADALDKWHRKEVARCVAAEISTQNADDRRDTLLCLMARDDIRTPTDLVEWLEHLFSEDRQAIQLMTAHKAKGLEADRVWLLRDTFTRFEGPAEKNLLYIAITRALHELVFVREHKER